MRKNVLTIVFMALSLLIFAQQESSKPSPMKAGPKTSQSETKEKSQPNSSPASSRKAAPLSKEEKATKPVVKTAPSPMKKAEE